MKRRKHTRDTENRDINTKKHRKSTQKITQNEGYHSSSQTMTEKPKEMQVTEI